MKFRKVVIFTCERCGTEEELPLPGNKDVDVPRPEGWDTVNIAGMGTYLYCCRACLDEFYEFLLRQERVTR